MTLFWAGENKTCSNLHVQDLVEYGLSQTFSHVPLMGSVDQL